MQHKEPETLSNVRIQNTKKLVQDKFLTLSNMARTLDKSVSYLSHLLAGSRPYSEKVAREIEYTLGLEPLSLDQDHNTTYLLLPVYNSQQKHPILTDSIKNHEKQNLNIIYATDNSMMPNISIRQGIVFDKSLITLHDNIIYLIELNNNILIRRVFKDILNNSIILKADNEIFSNINVTSSQIKVLGMAFLALERPLL